MSVRILAILCMARPTLETGVTAMTAVATALLQ
jgi:hypothetical protein